MTPTEQQNLLNAFRGLAIAYHALPVAHQLMRHPNVTKTSTEVMVGAAKYGKELSLNSEYPELTIAENYLKSGDEPAFIASITKCMGSLEENVNNELRTICRC